MKRKEDDLPYTGRTFVVTGVTNTPRADLVNRIRELGGKVTLGLSGVTNYLLTGNEPGPSKLKEALALGVKIISEEEFLEMTSHYIIQPAVVKKARTEQISKERWTEKHKPETSAGILGNKQVITQLKTHLLSLSQMPVMLAGASGTGKTLSVYLIAKELGISLIEYNGSDYRNKQEISIIKGLSTQQSLTREVSLHKNKAVLMEEVENMTSSDRGGLQEILELFKKTRIPIILTANDKSSQNIKTIVSKCKVLLYRKIDSRSIVGMLKSIAAKEGISVRENTLMQIAVTAGGDVRYAVNMLQYLSRKPTISAEDIKIMGKHITSTNLFDISKDIFQPHITAAQKIDLFFEDPMFILLMLFENYLGGSTLEETAKIIDTLSIAEIVGGNMISKDEKRLFPVAAFYTAAKVKLKLNGQLQFSRYLGLMSAQSARRKKLSKIINEAQERGMQGGWSTIYELFSVMKILERSVTEPTDAEKYIRALNIDKDALHLLGDITGVKIKPGKLPLVKTLKE